MAVVQQKTKAQKAMAAMSGGKSKKKKWSKGKMRDQVANKILFDTEIHERFQNEVPKMKLITPSACVERLKITYSLARAALREMAEEGTIRLVSKHSAQMIYTRAASAE